MIERAFDLVARGRVDADGGLVAADEPLAALNARAGGGLGSPLAVPQIAAIARLCRRLRVTVSRPTMVADGDHDVDIWVRAEPAGDEVALVCAGWTRRDRLSSLFGDLPGSRDFERSAADWHWETDARLQLTRLPDAMAGVIGGDPSVLIGAPLTRLFSFVGNEDGDMPVLVALAEHRRFDGQIAALRGASGARYRLSAVPMTDGRGGFAGFHGSAARVNPSDLLPTPDEDEGGAFGARLDEALRRPLGHIIASAENIKTQTEGPLRGEYTDYATDIASAGRHLLSLVDDLVDLQAIERPGFRPDRDALDLADVARRAAGLLGVRAAKATVRIDRPSESDTLAGTGEFRRTLQILVNLIGNAVRYAPPGSAISIRAERRGDLAAVIVADTGKGIAPADHARIFDKFERVDPSEPGGTGLGLYIARRLARAMCGDIAVDSALGEGARFTLTLPG